MKDNIADNNEWKSWSSSPAKDKQPHHHHHHHHHHHYHHHHWIIVVYVTKGSTTPEVLKVCPHSDVDPSLVQFKMVSKRSEKPILCTLSRFPNIAFETVPMFVWVECPGQYVDPEISMTHSSLGLCPLQCSLFIARSLGSRNKEIDSSALQRTPLTCSSIRHNTVRIQHVCSQ